MADPAAHLCDERRRKDMRFVDRPALHMLNSCALEAVLRWTAGATGNPKDRILQNVLHGTAEAEVQPIVARPVVVDLHVEGSRVLPELCVQREVIRERRGPVRHQIQDFEGDRAEERHWDDVRAAGWIGASWIEGIYRRVIGTRHRRHTRSGPGNELHAVRTVGIAGERVVYRSPAGRQIAVAERVGGYGDLIELPADVADVQNIHEEKGLVLNNRAAKAPAIVVVRGACQRVGRAVEIAARSQRAHTVVLVSRAVELVCTGLQNHIRHRTGGASKYSRPRSEWLPRAGCKFATSRCARRRSRPRSSTR